MRRLRLPKNITKVLEAVCAGDLTLEQGNMIINGIEKLATAYAATEVPDKEAELIAAFKTSRPSYPSEVATCVDADRSSKKTQAS